MQEDYWQRQNITIGNDGSRLSAEQIEEMIKEAEKFKEQDEEVKQNKRHVIHMKIIFIK